MIWNGILELPRKWFLPHTDNHDLIVYAHADGIGNAVWKPKGYALAGFEKNATFHLRQIEIKIEVLSPRFG